MADMASGAIGTAPAQVSAAHWQSFEMRMRKRRATRLMVRAQAALEQGRVAEAEAALEEARTLDSSPELDALLARVIVPEPASPEPAVSTPVHRFRGWMVVAASLLIVAALAMWDIAAPEPDAAPSATAAASPAVAEQPVAATAGRVEVPPIANTPEGPPRSTASTALGTEPSTIIAAPPAPARREETAAQAAPIEPLRAEPISELPVKDAIDVRIPASEPATAPPSVAATSDIAVPPPAVSAPVAPPQPVAESEPADETPLVRRVLSQYEAAYSSLDVSAAKRVWPSLDTWSLSRAFGGLRAQHVSLGDCSVTVTGAAARAACRGFAEWTPKVGAATRSGNRTWSFDLAKTDGQWRILDATVR